MSVEFNSPYTVFIDEAERRVTVLDQRLLPHRVEHVDLKKDVYKRQADRCRRQPAAGFLKCC